MHKEAYLSSIPAYSGIDLNLETSAASQVEEPAHLLTVKLSFGKVIVAHRVPKADAETWAAGFQHVANDHRYYELTQETLGSQFGHHYLVFKDHSGATRAIQPFLLVDQDVVAGMPKVIRDATARIRQHFPATCIMRTLMIGCSAGEGNLVRDRVTDGFEWVVKALKEALPIVARNLHAKVIVFKDFPKSYRSSLSPLAQEGYTRVPSMPGSCLDLAFKDFEEYMTKRLSHKTRKNLRFKYRKAAAGPKLEMEVVADITPYIDEIFPLYQQVLERSQFKFEQLTKSYFSTLGQKMQDRSLFFIWRQNGKAIAFSSCLVHDGVLRDHYIGLDYTVALDLHLYFVTWRDIFTWAVENGYRSYYSAPLNYEPKYHLRHDLVPLDLYVRATWDWLNPFFRLAVRYLEPTRYDPMIRKFSNAHEL